MNKQDLIKINTDVLTEYKTSEDPLSVFHSYDMRGIYPEELDEEMAYKVVKAFLQVNPGKRFVVGNDMRKSSNPLKNAVITSFMEEGCEVDYIGEVTTDQFYFAVGKYGYDGGIMVTASHNAAIFNGLKFIRKDVKPVVMAMIRDKYLEVKDQCHYMMEANKEPTRKIDVMEKFVQHVLTFSEGVEIKPMKVVIDVGNGMAGEITNRLFANHKNVELVKMYFEPNSNFPHHEANPAVPANLLMLQEKVKETGADIGVAFDGDGDRVFFVDRDSKPVPGYYIQALLSEYFLNIYRGDAVIYDLRNTRAIESIARVTGGRGVVSKAGHTFMKEKMRQEDAVFGGESTSSHFYFRDNYYADSGIITLEIILKIISQANTSLDNLVKTYRERFHISGEKNFYTEKPERFEELTQRLKNEFSQGSFSDFDGFVIDFPNWRFSLRQSNTEPFWRLNIEADSKELLKEKQASIMKIIEDYAQYTSYVTNLSGLKTLNLDKKDKLEYLFSNLYYIWNQYKANYLDGLYGSEWTRNQTPMDVLRQIDPPILETFYEKNKYNIEETIRLQKTYLGDDTWFDAISQNDRILDRLHQNPVAYFSLEFGLVDWLQIYSGGLGVLAGDTLKEASDSGLPMIGIGLFYAQGYFYQRFSEDGWQLEDYLAQDTDDYPMETVKDNNGFTIVVDVKLGTNIVKVRAWRMAIGRRSLILLDTNFSENKNMEDRMITYHLYGGDQDTRIKQELVLAMGGYKILKAAGIDPSILHLNEGHSAFAVIAQAQEIMNKKGLNFDDAIVESRKNVLFTNHTLKQAGNDVFPYALVEKYLNSYAEDMHTTFRHVFALGVDSLYAEGKFGMTILGLNNANKINAVSEIHAVAAKKIWPDHDLVPVTNGVHLSTWISEPIHQMLDEYISERWNEQGANVNWAKIHDIPDNILYNAHVQSKKALVYQIKDNCGIELEENALIFGWFRRLTSYKQPEILTLDLDRLERIVNNSDRPVRFIFGGKAHPRDDEGKALLQRMYQISKEPRFYGKLILIPDYNWRMAKYLVSGADVWVNSPIRLQEACGTSGMKAGANGLMQFSTIDGWIDEVKDKDMIWEIKDSLDTEQYYNTIENTIIPLFWERDESGVPSNWVKKMKITMQHVLGHYGTDRMLRDYIEKLYKPILKEVSA